MKIERSQRAPSECQVIAFPDAAVGCAPAKAFAAALRHHKQRQAAHREESNRASDSSSVRRTGGRVAALHQRSADADEYDWLVTSEGAPELPLDSPHLLSMLFMRKGRGAQEYAAAAAQREPRRRRGNDDDNESPCIEITHSSTGIRCLLSRQDGVWILSLQSQSSLSLANRRALLETLRSQFTERGLGPIDIVL